jgi:two-component system, OmpR family, sensor histidine kinase SenX3
MPLRRLPLALLAPVSLLLLVVALGALQYRWVGQVSEAERDQLKQSLDRRSREFADEFDREIGRAFQVFRPAAGSDPSAPARFTQQYEEWQATARFPALLKTAYYATQRGNDLVLHRYAPATHAFDVVEWPASLEPVRTRLTRTLPKMAAAAAATPNEPGLTSFVITTLPVMPEIPALVISGPATLPPGAGVEAIHAPGLPASFTVDVRSAHNYVVLELDKEQLASTVLPALAERHFPEGDADRFRIAVVDNNDQLLMSRGLSGKLLDVSKADATAPLFGIRLETMRSMMSPLMGQSAKPTVMFSTRFPEPAASPQPGAGSGGASSGTVVIAKPGTELRDRLSMVIEQHSTEIARTAATRTVSDAGWTLLLQHGAGSLDAAVNRVRHRNLWLSFGILGVLAASAGLVMVNARRSEKLAAQQMDFVATVSHELRTPVAVIRSAAQNLAAGVVYEPDQARRYGDLIEAEGRRLTDMVEQVLEYAGLSDAKRLPNNRPVDTGRLVRDVVAASESLPEADRITFEVRIDDGAPAVMAEEDSLRRALLNLIGNALKYGADGEWIGVTVARGTGRDDGHVMISVADRGRGIGADELAHIFKPFYRGEYARDRQIHGNGLGLSLVKRIAEAHGGRVTVKSAPGQGTTFTIVLPFATRAAATTPALADSTHPVEGPSA